MKWGLSFRVRHITTGRYLFLDEEKGLLLVDAEKAKTQNTAFCFRASKVCILLSSLYLTHWEVALLKMFSNNLRHQSSCDWVGEDGGGSETWCGGNGDPRDQVWRVHVLCAACLYQSVAHICLGGCQICSAGATEKEGTNINTHYCFTVSHNTFLVIIIDLQKRNLTDSRHLNSRVNSL